MPFFFPQDIFFLYSLEDNHCVLCLSFPNVFHHRTFFRGTSLGFRVLRKKLRKHCLTAQEGRASGRYLRSTCGRVAFTELIHFSGKWPCQSSPELTNLPYFISLPRWGQTSQSNLKSGTSSEKENFNAAGSIDIYLCSYTNIHTTYIPIQIYHIHSYTNIQTTYICSYFNITIILLIVLTMRHQKRIQVVGYF